MAITRFSIGKLADLDLGKVDKAVKHALRTLVEDVRERLEVGKARTLTLKISVKPDDFDVKKYTLETVRVGFEISTSIPKRCSLEYPMKVGASDELLFNDLSPDEPRQGTLDDAEEQNKRKGGSK